MTNKIIFILTPQKWGKMYISKHHYAMELSKSNIVYFIDPPDYSLKVNFNLKKIRTGLFIVHYKPFIPIILRFKMRWLFDFLMSFQIKLLLNKIGQRPDIVWSFDNLTFINLNKFRAKLKIYHPVDSLIYNFQYRPAKYADILFAVSETILTSFSSYHIPKYFINHGISEEVKIFAQNNLKYLETAKEEETKKRENIHVGYVGNLLINVIQHEVIKQIIIENVDVRFNFWGPFDPNDSNLGGSLGKDVKEFIFFLKHAPNVILHGVKNTSELMEDINKMDAFFLFYHNIEGVYDRSNSHKILEYLTTGKVIISNCISTYKDYKGLIQMPPKDNDNLLSSIFNNVIQNLDFHNNIALQKERINLALENTYKKQIDKIDSYINKHYIKY